MANYLHGTVTVGTTPSTIAVQPTNDGILLTNQGSVTVYIGGPGVTADQTATGGFPIAASETVTIPTVGSAGHTLYLVVASGTAAVSYIQPSVN